MRGLNQHFRADVSCTAYSQVPQPQFFFIDILVSKEKQLGIDSQTKTSDIVWNGKEINGFLIEACVDENRQARRNSF